MRKVLVSVKEEAEEIVKMYYLRMMKRMTELNFQQSIRPLGRRPFNAR
jgi:hypothetical protein